MHNPYLATNTQAANAHFGFGFKDLETIDFRLASNCLDMTGQDLFGLRNFFVLGNQGGNSEEQQGTTRNQPSTFREHGGTSNGLNNRD